MSYGLFCNFIITPYQIPLMKFNPQYFRSRKYYFKEILGFLFILFAIFFLGMSHMSSISLDTLLLLHTGHCCCSER